MKSEHGEFELDIPRNRNCSFEPVILSMLFHTLYLGIQNKILIDK